MRDCNHIKETYIKVKDAILADYPLDMIEKAVTDMLTIFEEEDGDYVTSFDELQLALDIQETGILLSVLKGRIDVTMVNAMDYGAQMDKFRQLAFLSEDQNEKIQKRIFYFLKRIRDLYCLKFIRKTHNRTPDCKCMLCQKAEAIVTNSHIVPRFIIQRFFNLDGSNTRDIEAVDSWSLQDGENYRNFGTDASADIFEKVLGFKVTQSEIEEYTKSRTLARDYVFCSHCEKRFGVIETLYSEIARNPGRAYNHAIPYLFWMSVIWRMSAVGMGIKLSVQHEEKLRKILNNSLAETKTGIITDYRKLGHFAYIIAVANDTRDETLGVFGHHQYMLPYVFMIGNMVFNFYPTINKAFSNFRRKGHDLSLINDGISPEVIQNLSFIDFWLAKRTIFDTNYRFHAQWEQPYSIIDYSASLTKEAREALVGEDTISFDTLPPQMPGYWKMNVPRSMMKIRKFIETHPDGASSEELEKATGYSSEEIAVMLSYVEENIKPQRAD